MDLTISYAKNGDEIERQLAEKACEPRHIGFSNSHSVDRPTLAPERGSPGSTVQVSSRFLRFLDLDYS